LKEKRIKKLLIQMLEWRSFDTPTSRCFHMIFFSSSPNLSNEVSNRVFWRILIWWWRWIIHLQPKPAFKDNYSTKWTKLHGNRKAARNHGQAVVAAAPSSALILERRTLGLRLGLRFLPWIRCIRRIGPLLLASLNTFGLKSLFSPST